MDRFSSERGHFVDRWRGMIAAARNRGSVALWGAGAKGATFALLVDPEHREVDCVIDVNPRKQGGFIPLTGHPIVSPNDAAQREVATIFVMNPNYRDEVADLCAQLSLSAALEVVA